MQRTWKLIVCILQLRKGCQRSSRASICTEGRQKLRTLNGESQVASTTSRKTSGTKDRGISYLMCDFLPPLEQDASSQTQGISVTEKSCTRKRCPLSLGFPEIPSTQARIVHVSHGMASSGVAKKLGRRLHDYF